MMIEDFKPNSIHRLMTLVYQIFTTWLCAAIARQFTLQNINKNISKSVFAKHTTFKVKLLSYSIFKLNRAHKSCPHRTSAHRLSLCALGFCTPYSITIR